MTYILGISCFYHDSAACLLHDEKIIAAFQEERLTRKKHDSSFPKNAVVACLKEAGISLSQVDFVGFYDKPLIKFERLIETYLGCVPKGFESFKMAIPIWLKEKLFLKDTLIKELAEIEAEIRGFDCEKNAKEIKKQIEGKILFGKHHDSHAASCFYPSPFEEAAIITMDGVGEWATTALGYGKNNDFKLLHEIKFPNSLGLLYSALTYYCGFKVNSGEYKLMGLAPYGAPKYADLIKEKLIDIKEDGSFRLDMKYFDYMTGLTMTNKKFENLFGVAARKPESELEQFHMDVAASIQKVTEEVVIKLAKFAKDLTSSKNLVMAGGVALNCVANGKLWQEKIFENIWVQPAAGDAGGALGVAQDIYYRHLGKERKCHQNSSRDNMQGSYLGNACSKDEIESDLKKYQAVYDYIGDESELINKISDFINEGKVIGWHQGRMEFGPRALGARSIIGDARNSEMQSTMNLKIKFRESFRPFAPAVLEEKVADYFEFDDKSPYMLMVANVRESLRKKVEENNLFGVEKLKQLRSEIPAITHVDYSARLQTVDSTNNPRFYKLIKNFGDKTGCYVLINTSFNVRGEPIVCNAQDSYKCFMRTGIDILVIENYVLLKEKQPDFKDQQQWRENYVLD